MGITQKSCVTLFSLWSLKKKFLFLFLGGGSRADVNQQRLTKKKSKLKFDKKSFDKNLLDNIKIAIIIIEITKNDYHNNNNSNNNNNNNNNNNSKSNDNSNNI